MNKDRRILAIDPGQNGGMALLDGDSIYMFPLTNDNEKTISRIKGINPDKIVIEDVGKHIQGNSAHASVTFGRHVGFLHGVIATLEIPCYTVTPQAWMNALPDRPKGMKKEQVHARKQYIQAWCNMRYPDVPVTLAAADALAILIICAIDGDLP